MNVADTFRLDIAEDSNASAGTRLNAAGDALGDKKDELKHKVSFPYRPTAVRELTWRYPELK